MKTDFYKAFEDKYRGPRELIKTRLRVYEEFILSVKKIEKNAKALDLGCGRGEWLEILSEHGFEALGVDSDEYMLNQAKKVGLTVQLGNAIDFLKNVAAESQIIVSAFHLVEHIPFDSVRELVQESLRVLCPGGILILETPNPENIVVGSANFYLDPTHNKPIPPNLLVFLPEYYGYKKYKILRLQESKHLANSPRVKLIDVLNGASPDYAVVAQKDGSKEALQLTNNAFLKHYGLTIEELAATYHRGFSARWLKNKLKSIIRLDFMTFSRLKSHEVQLGCDDQNF